MGVRRHHDRLRPVCQSALKIRGSIAAVLIASRCRPIHTAVDLDKDRFPVVIIRSAFDLFQRILQELTIPAPVPVIQGNKIKTIDLQMIIVIRIPGLRLIMPDAVPSVFIKYSLHIRLDIMVSRRKLDRKVAESLFHQLFHRCIEAHTVPRLLFSFVCLHISIHKDCVCMKTNLFRPVFNVLERPFLGLIARNMRIRHADKLKQRVFIIIVLLVRFIHHFLRECHRLFLLCCLQVPVRKP